MSGGNFLLTKFIQNLCAAGALIADHLMPGSSFQLRDQFRRKSCLSERDKRLFCLQAHHLPVACHGVLSPAGLIEFCVICQRMFYRFYSLQRVKIGNSQLLHIGNRKSLHMRGNVPKSICPCITKLLRIHGTAHPQGIYNDHKHSSESFFTFHLLPLFCYAIFSAPDHFFSFRISSRTASTATCMAPSVSCTTGFGRSFFARSWLATTRKTLPARTFR